MARLCIGLFSYPGIPEIVAAKFRRAQMLYFLAWLYFDLIKAGELVGMTALELALRNRYGNQFKRRRGSPKFAHLLEKMLADGLTDDKVPLVKRSGGSVIGLKSMVWPSRPLRRSEMARRTATRLMAFRARGYSKWSAI